jgi:hypothetical protein
MGGRRTKLCHDDMDASLSESSSASFSLSRVVIYRNEERTRPGKGGTCQRHRLARLGTTRVSLRQWQRQWQWLSSDVVGDVELWSKMLTTMTASYEIVPTCA